MILENKQSTFHVILEAATAIACLALYAIFCIDMPQLLRKLLGSGIAKCHTMGLPTSIDVAANYEVCCSLLLAGKVSANNKN